MSVRYRVDGPIAVITIDRPEVANAIDRPTAEALADAFRRFDADESLSVAVLTGANGKFCAGADLKAMRDDPARVSRVAPDGDGPVGPTRMLLGKPSSRRSRGTPSRAVSSSPPGATSASRPRTPCSASSVGAGAFR